MQLIRPIQTRSRFGSEPLVLNLAAYHNSPDHSTIGTWSPIDGLSVLVSTGFQVLFHSPPGVLFTFPSQYFFAIGHQGIFRLGGWSPRLPSGFLVSRCTLDTAVGLLVSCTGLSPSLAGFPKTFLLPYLHHIMQSTTPRRILVWPVSRSLAAT